jgi:hypothetical protein
MVEPTGEQAPDALRDQDGACFRLVVRREARFTDSPVML